ncbi:AAA family ATPase [Kamptonema animale CS-326]|jgi:ABC-type transport system involved in cytochrome c biogenesis ATPase subunit|uniref:ATP-dependent nuclease n=1 Tax=Kamptonema animale TaxID=92934 RepID=UPI00232E511E|nr:AAA family ATPase [Kamptonema animale]MDB9513453.1 AAA family ATPase [Kamptonema animale CS-326]
MSFPTTIKYAIPELFGAKEQSFVLHSGLTIFVGPNGAGKTQVMRYLKEKSLEAHSSTRKVRYLSAGRIAPLESFISNFDGQRGKPQYDSAALGGKNYSQYRHQAETAYGDFHTLSLKPELQIKVAARLQALFKRDMYIEWDEGKLKVKFKRLDWAGKSYSFAREASGLLNIVVILAALYDDEVSILLLDEPEISLHPQYQSFLLREIQAVAGDPTDSKKKIVIMATHSPTMLPIQKVEDLTRIVFFSNAETSPSQVPDDAGELKNKNLKALISRLGASHKEAFFSEYPLLVEGPSDSIICNALDQCLNLYLGVGGTQIVPVTGKDNMPVTAKLMRLMGKKPIILADLDGLTDGNDLVAIFFNDHSAEKLVQEKGHTDLSTFIGKVNTDFCSAIKNHWDDLQLEAEKHTYWSKKDPEKNEEISRKRSGMAVLLSSTKSQRAAWNYADWEKLYTRLNSLLESLEKAGCFFLRKGTIENYYQCSNRDPSSDKPRIAAQEAEEFANKERSFFEEHYADVVKALNYAAQAPTIDEATKVSELLLAVAAPLLSQLKQDTNQAQLEAIAEGILRERATLFQIEKTSTVNELSLKFDLKPKTLNVSGFPITLNKGQDPIKDVEAQIKGKHDHDIAVTGDY